MPLKSQMRKDFDGCVPAIPLFGVLLLFVYVVINYLRSPKPLIGHKSEYISESMLLLSGPPTAKDFSTAGFTLL